MVTHMQEDTAFLRPRRPELPVWDLEVIRTEEVAPRMRRVVLTGLGLDSFHYRPGQALILRVPLPEGGIGRRDYTIRAFDRARHELAIDFLLHGETPAPNWARAARPGDRIEARGPRGRTTFAEGADWHLFLGDETCLPAILHILEEVPPGTRAFAFLEVADVFDQLPVETPADLTLT